MWKYGRSEWSASASATSFSVPALDSRQDLALDVGRAEPLPEQRLQLEAATEAAGAGRRLPLEVVQRPGAILDRRLDVAVVDLAAVAEDRRAVDRASAHWSTL